MPTPDEDTVTVPPSPPIEVAGIRSSCPPEEERLSRRGSRADSTTDVAGHETSTMRQQMPTPEPDTPQSTAQRHDSRREDLGEEEKAEHIEDTVAGASRRESEDSPGPESSPDAPSEGWSRESVVGRAEERVEEDEGTGARYLEYPPLRRNSVSGYHMEESVGDWMANVRLYRCDHTPRPPSSDPVPNSKGRSNPTAKSTTSRSRSRT